MSEQQSRLPCILVVAKRLDIGGTEQHLARMLPRLKKQGLDISLFLLERGGVLEDIVAESGIVINGPQRVLPRYLHLLSAAWQLNRYIRRNRPDIVHYFLSEPYLVGSMATLATKDLVQIMSRRSLNDYQRHHPILAKIERWMHGRTSVLLGNSSAVVADLIRECADRSKIGLIQNGIEIPEPIAPERRRLARRDLHLADDTFVLSVSANLIPYKGHHDLLDALGLIKNQLPENWRVLLIGRDDGIGAELRAKSVALGINENVIWLDQRKDAQSPLDAVDVSVLPSHQEGFSNSLIEAMGRGLPVVATAVGGNLDAVVHGASGLLVPVSDPQELASAILALSKDAALRETLGRQAIGRVTARFSIDECVSRYMRLYRGWPYKRMRSAQDLIDPGSALAGSIGARVDTPLVTQRMAYLALDVPHEGQASDIHIAEIVGNLRHLGWHIDLYAPVPGLGSSSQRRIIRGLAYLRVLFNVIRSMRKYEVLYIRAHLLAWPVSFVAHRRGMPVVQEVNGTELDVIVAHPWLGPFRSFIRWLYLSQYRMADHLLPVTERLGDWLRAAVGHERVTVISNAANTDIFVPIETSEDKSFVVFFGSLTHWHGVDVMMEAIRHPDWPKGVELVVIGAGAKQGFVEDAIKEGAPVRWLGHRRYWEIPHLIAGALAGLVPITNPEGRSSTGVMPLKLFEMLACGIPVIVSDLPGQAELVRDGNCGLVIPCGNAPALASAVAKLAAERESARAMGKRGSVLVRAKHSWAARASEIDQIVGSSFDA